MSIERNMSFECVDGDISSTYITHPTINGQSIEFDTRFYRQVSKEKINPDSVYLPVNLLLQTIPLEKQIQLYGYYQNLRDILDRVSDQTIAMSRLSEVIADMLDTVVTYETIDNWRQIRSNIPIPPDLVQTFYSETASPRTYNHEDYKGLINLSILTRFIAPIWANFSAIFSKELPRDLFEYYAYALLGGSWVVDHKSVELLENYLQSNMEVEDIMKSSGANSAITSGLAKEDIAKYLLAISLVRRGPVPNLYGTEKDSNLIAIFYQFAIKSIGKDLEKRFSGKIKDRSTIRNGNDSAENITHVDNCKVRSVVPASVFIVNSYYLKNKMIDFISKFCSVYPDIISTKDFDIYPEIRECVDKTSMGLIRVESEERSGLISEVNKFRLVMTQWTLGAVISPYACYGGTEETDNIIAVATCFMLATGHHDLAVLINSVPIMTEASHSSDESSIPGIRRMAASDFYPHFNRVKNTNSSSKSKLLDLSNSEIEAKTLNNQRKINNPAIAGSRECVKLIPFIEWKTMLPSSIRDNLTLTGNMQNNGNYFAPSSRLNVIFNYAMKIGQCNQ